MRTPVVIVALGLGLGLVASEGPQADAAGPPVPSRWRGQVRGVVYGQPFVLPFDVELTRRLLGERNPFHLFAGTRADPGADVGSSYLSSAQRVVTPVTGRRVTLRYLRVTTAGRTIRARLVDTHKDEAMAINGFTAPNVCLTVYTPFECVLPGPELFAFRQGATLTLRISGRRITGTVDGTGTGYAQVLPYPEVRYSATVTAKRRT